MIAFGVVNDQAERVLADCLQIAIQFEGKSPTRFCDRRLVKFDTLLNAAMQVILFAGSYGSIRWKASNLLRFSKVTTPSHSFSASFQAA